MQKSNSYYYWCLNTCAFLDWIYLQIIAGKLMKPPHGCLAWKERLQRMHHLSLIPHQLSSILFLGGFIKVFWKNNLFCLLWCKRKVESINSTESQSSRASTAQAQQRWTGSGDWTLTELSPVAALSQSPGHSLLVAEHRFTAWKPWLTQEGRIRKRVEVFLHFKAI